MNKIKKGILAIFMLSIILTNSVFAAETLNVKAIKECPVLLQYGNIKIGTTLAKVNINDKEYPVYCLDVSKPGVAIGKLPEYNVTLKDTIENQEVYRAIINGYPYKTIEELGVKTEEEAFTATKQAVYSMLYNRNVDEYSAINTEAGHRTYNAYRNIVLAARGSNKVYENAKFELKADKEWKKDEENKYLYKNVEVNANLKSNFDIKLEGDKNNIFKLEKEQIVGKEKDNKKEKYILKIDLKDINKFNILGKEIFKNLKLTATAEVETNPVYLGKEETGTRQDYAISGVRFKGKEERSLNIDIPKNETKIKIVKISKEEDKKLENVKFELFDKENKSLGIKTTNKNGEIIYENLIPGKYYLKEIEAKEGYNKLNDLVEIEVKYGEEKEVKVNNEKIKIIVNNKKEVKKLPKTGYSTCMICYNIYIKQEGK